jgi:hypothetical protein
MKKKTLFSLLIIAVLALYLVIANNRGSQPVVELQDFEDGLDEITISRQDTRIKIYRHGSDWVINEEKYPADAGQVSTIEKKLKELKVTDLISRKKYYQRYELEADNALHVIARKDGNTVRDFYVGKKSPTYQQTYIRFPGKEGIYLASGTLDTDFDKKIDDLREKEVLKIEKNAIESIMLTYRGRTLNFNRVKVEKQMDEEKDGTTTEKDDMGKEGAKKTVSQDKWICAEYPAVKLDENQVTQLVTAFDPLRAKSFPDMKKQDVKGMMSRVQLKAYGKTITVTVHRKYDDTTYLATSSESDYPFVIDEFRAKKLFKTIGDLEK